jgi:hypothetical protein
MATDVGTVKGPAAKYDAFVAEQLARANGRIRALDLTAALLGFGALTLLYVVAVVICDSKLHLTASTRLTALLFYLIGAGVYLTFTVIRPLCRRINPYYAATKVEATVPGAKNSVINWVDLQDRPLPAAVHGAIGQRAARDLKHADVERAISGRRAGWAGTLLAAACIAFAFAYFALGPSPFRSLLGRALAPLGGEGIATRTHLKVVEPRDGNATVTVGQPLKIAVEVRDKVPDPKAPDAVRLRYRYDDGEPYLERLLVQPDARSPEFSLTIPAADVRNGFWYHVAGGDAVTPEYRISVRAAPFLTDFQATYKFRKYVSRPNQISPKRELEALRGTTAVLLARTNRTVKEARLEVKWDGGEQENKRTQHLPADPQSFEFTVELKANGRYRLFFTSAEEEAYEDPAPHTIKVLPDKSPVVEITKPAQDVRLPADGVLQIEGRATDDIGVTSILLRGQVVGGPKLKAKPYRSDDKMRLADGGYPGEVDYQDFLDLAKAQTELGKPLALKARMELEYWLEARDGCDYPRPNVGESKHYKIMLAEPEKNAAKQQQQRQKADQDKKQQEQKQDAKQQQENTARKEERDKQEAENAKKQQGNDAKPNNQGDPKQEDKPKPEPKKPDEKDNGKPKENPDQQVDPDKDLTPEQKDQKQRLKEALKRQERQEKGDDKAEPKGDKQQQPGEAKDDNKKGEGTQAAGEKSEGQPKDAGTKPDGAKQAGENKDKGKEQGGQADKQPGASKDEGKPDPMKASKAQGKPENKQGAANEQAKADAKPQGAQGSQDKRSESKPSGKPEQSQAAGQPKPEGKNSEKESPKGEKKEPGPEAKTPEGRQALGEKKDNPGDCKCQCKGGGNNPSANAGSAKAGNSGGGKPGGGNAKDQGDAKPSGGKGSQESAKAEGKPEGSTPKNGKGPEDATPEDVRRIAKGLQSSDRQTREGAADSLEQIRDLARDAQARADARDALNKAGLGGGGEPKPAPNKAAGSGNAKPQAGDGSSAAGKPRGDGKPDAKEGESKGSKEGNGQGEKKPGESKPQGPGKAQGQGKEPAGDDPGQGQPGRRTGTNRPPSADPKGPKGKPSPPEASRAATLQLEDFKKRVDKNILKDAKMSEEEYRKFLRAYEEALRRHKERAERPEQLPEAQPTAPLRSFTTRRDKRTDAGSGDLEGENRALPPAPYRDAYEKFTRQLSPGGDKK